MKFDDNIKIAIIIYSVIAFALFYYKPSFAFNSDGTFKQFGLTKDKTIYPYWLVILIIGIIGYLCIIIKQDEYI